MAYKKRVEVEEEMPNLENIKIDTTPEEHLQEVPKVEHKEVSYESKPRSTKQEASEPINCLRNERIILRFVPSPNALVQSKGHVLSGGMAEGAKRSFVVPRLRSGQYVNVLTDNEMKKLALEMSMGIYARPFYSYRMDMNKKM